MRSKASFKSHPIHPALIPFPLAFLVGAFGFNAAGLLLADPEFVRIGGWLTVVGIASALVAAVPGLIDYFYTVPPRSTGKRRATTIWMLIFSRPAAQSLDGRPGPVISVPFSMRAHPGWATMTEPSCEVMPSK